MNLIKKESVFFSVSLVFLILLITSIFGVITNSDLVSAEFSLRDNQSYHIDGVYGPGDYLRGWISISLENEPVDSVLEDNQDNEITLIEWLESDPGIYKDTDYSCSPNDCGIGYSVIDSSTSQNFSLGGRDVKILGFEFNDDIGNIENIEFDVQSNAAPSCNNQLEIDFFSDSTVLIGNNKTTGNICTSKKSNGCFDAARDDYEEYYLETENMYCQKIRFSESPGFEIGAYIINEVADAEINMRVYGEDFGESKDTCSFDIDAEEGYYSCKIDFAVAKSKEYYLCVDTSEGKGDAGPRVRGYQSDNGGCGFYYSGSGAQPENYAFDVYITGKEFDEIGKISVKKDMEFLPGDTDLTELMQDYIGEKYNWDLNCEDSACIVPVKFTSYADQNITVENISIQYKKEAGPITYMDEISVLSTSPARINSINNFTKISLENINFSMPTSFKTYDYKMELGNEELFEEVIVIEKIPSIKSLTPTVTASGFPTPLEVDVELVDNASITEYKWEINGVTETTSANKLTYTFSEYGGSYDVTVSVTDENDKTASKTFKVFVNSPREMISSELEKKQQNLNNIITEIEEFPLFHQNSIKQVINTDALNTGLTELQRLATQADGEDDYNALIPQILDLKIPSSIQTGLSTGQVSFYSKTENVDVGAVSNIAGGSYDVDEESDYKSGVVDWGTSYANTKVKYTQINAIYNGNPETLLNIFDVHIKEIVPVEYPYYLFIKKMRNLNFDKNYQEANESDYVAIQIDTPDKIIKFSTTEPVTFTNLPIFLSPSLDNIEVLQIIEEGEEPQIKWALFILILFFLIIFGVVIYIVLQHWYKTKYETYLFKNRNYLFNLINYINAQKKKGEKEKDIVKKLKKQGWNSEQITYVMKKYLGKRTGMWEIPIDKLLGKFLKKKQQGAQASGQQKQQAKKIARTGFAPKSARQGFGKPRPGAQGPQGNMQQKDQEKSKK
ncbi:hypothetical protein GF378_02805 [Candidatus Pacearchaeota archaeon]|nr:hypothetical protein [Candidatus Pacearchaeota archaeon]